MKADTHPEYHPVIFKDGDDEIVTRSTMTSKKTRDIDGVEHYVIPLDISAFSHPFYTGKQKLVDTEGRVDRFMKRYNLQTEEEKKAAGATDGVENDEDGDENDEA
jgi:large subunit ribosomal protein L31